MACEYCYGINEHDYRCPNYIPSTPSRYCSICNEGIYANEEYVANKNDKYAHYDCFTDLSFHSMIEWLGGEIRIMEEDDYEKG